MSKNIIIICIHDREQNLRQWLHVWAQCKQDCQLVVIHSDSGKSFEVPDGVIYLKRPNIGYDIGKFQQVCNGTMPGLPEWDNLLWCSDDCMPMVKDFASPFFNALKTPGVGVACMEISPFVREHIRTTGFAISKQVAQKLTFPADPVISKDHCYSFEHRSVANHFLAQIKAMGLKAVMVSPKEDSPMFDFGYGRRLRHREAAFYKLFGRPQVQLHNGSRAMATMPPPAIQQEDVGVVSFICPIYDKYPQIISSLLCQTYENWRLYLIHDGPEPIDLPDDPRIIYERIERNGNDYGHSIRKAWLQKIRSEYVVITNPDNYYMPPFIKLSLAAFTPNAVAVYCNRIVHSYTNWKVMECRLQRGFIDCGQVMLRTAQAASVGFNSTDHSADWFFFENVAKEYGPRSFVPYNACLFVHN